MKRIVLITTFLVCNLIIVQAQICPGPLGPNLFPQGNFGSGTPNIVPVNPLLAPGYQYQTSPPPNDGFYCITNDIGVWSSNFGWLEIGDNSPDPNGYMMVVNASYDAGLFYEHVITGLCPNTSYAFSCDIINLVHSGANMILPNVSFLIDGVVKYNTGNIPETEQWNTYGFLFTTGANQSSVTLSLRNNASGGVGNDLALDNISFGTCGPEVILPLQEEMSSFTSYCQGLTIAFENLSYGSSVYEWDFGVPGVSTDVIQGFAPVFTYPTAGTYEVMVIANPGYSCTDTAYMTVTVNDEISVSFISPATQCITGNSFDFQGQGVFPGNGVTFTWDFGADATPISSSVQDPTNIVYASSGIKQVTFTVMYDQFQCEGSHTADVLVSAPSTINFGVPDELRCVPYTTQFSNFSTSSTQLFSFWDFGDGQFSTDTHPFHTYDQVGIYDVSLTVWTTSGCIDTLSLLRPNLIEVHPVPTSQFSISPPNQLIYDANFFFVDESIDAVESWFYFSDGSYTNQDSVWHNYTEAGVHVPWQIVYNEFGCSDKSYGTLTVTPVLELIVPNAFTPNGDAFNNVFQPVLFQDQEFELMIYNKWGEEIYYSKAMNANWDGTNNGVLVPDGIYVWKIKYFSFSNDEIPIIQSGHVTVLR